MAHGHHHDGDVSNYFTEQLLTILVCGLFGFVGIQMYRNGMLGNILAPQFHTAVLIGGGGVLILVVIRALAVWREAGEYQAQAGGLTCGQDHVHSADCNHGPAFFGADHDHDHTDDHSHSHDMSWVFARMLVLVFPVALFFLGLPNSGYSANRQLALAGNDVAIPTEDLKALAKDAEVVSEKKLDDGSTIRTLKTKNKLTIRETIPAGSGEPVLALVTEGGAEMRFNDLMGAAYDPAKRQSYEGQTAILEGRFKRLSDKEFTLFRLKMTCCAADTTPLKARIVVPQALSQFSDFDWVRVKGQIQFVKIPGQKNGPEEYLPVIMVGDITDVQKAPPKSDYE